MLSPKLLLKLNNPKAFAITLLIASGCSYGPATDSSPSANAIQNETVPGELIIVAKREHKNIVHKISRLGPKSTLIAKALDKEERFLHLKGLSQEEIVHIEKELSTDPEIEIVQPNYVYKTTLAPNDPHYGRLWGLKNSAQTVTGINPQQDSVVGTNNPGTSDADVGAESAWDLVTDCRNVNIAVLDSGAKLTHEDLVDNLWSDGPIKGFDAIDNDDVPDDLVNGHGTHVTSTIAATGNNGIGSTGVCWRASITPVRVLNNDGSGSTASVISGINYATQTRGAKLINMSLGGAGANPDNAYKTAIENAANTLFIVAAGNNGTNNTTSPFWLCNFGTMLSNVVCVGAVDQAFALANYSNYSPTEVQIAAPGTNIFGSSSNSGNITLDDFTNWTIDSVNWGRGGGALYIPANYDGHTNQYANDLESSSIRNLTNLENYDYVSWKSAIEYDIDNSDVLTFAAGPNSGDLFTNPLYRLATLSNSSGSGTLRSLDISSACAQQSSCYFGWQLKTNSSGTKHGVKFSEAQLGRFAYVNNSYKIIRGTSMATPHVTGVAALIWAYNPSFGVSDVKTALFQGGRTLTALNGKVSTGKVVNAMGSLTHISKPSAPTVE